MGRWDSLATLLLALRAGDVGDRGTRVDDDREGPRGCAKVDRRVVIAAGGQGMDRGGEDRLRVAFHADLPHGPDRPLYPKVCIPVEEHPPVEVGRAAVPESKIEDQGSIAPLGGP